MEDEGIFYFFTHSRDGHKLILADTVGCHPDVPHERDVSFDETTGGRREQGRVYAWEKCQQVRADKVTLWDYCFELPDQNLAASMHVQTQVTVGNVQHPLGLTEMEIFDYPGGYAQRHDGIGPNGAECAANLQQIFSDNARTARLRMEEEAAMSLSIEGTSTCAQFTSGHLFQLKHHADGAGSYVLTKVEHTASIEGSYATGPIAESKYENVWSAIPNELPFRPARSTPKPVITGTQTALVVGPESSETFCDKYGRVKVQFHWDRHGQKNAGSSCWLRVAQPWAGQGFGSFHLPRVKHEVVVAFEEGDPDQPIIVGSVYNAVNMPPYTLPENANYTGLLSRSFTGNSSNASELRFEDHTPGQEKLVLHAERDMETTTEHSRYETVGNQHQLDVGQGMYVRVGSKSGSGSGGGHAASTSSSSQTKDIAGIEFDISGSWTKISDMTWDIALGNCFDLTLGAVEYIVVLPEIDVFLTDYTIITLISSVTITAGFQFNFSAGWKYEIDKATNLRATPNKIEAITGLYNVTVGGGQVLTVTGTQLLTLEGERMDFVDGSVDSEVTTTMTTTVGGARTETTTGVHTITSEGLLSLTSTAGISLRVGTSTLTMTDTGITLSLGTVSLSLSADGVSVVGGPDSYGMFMPSDILLVAPTVSQLEA